MTPNRGKPEQFEGRVSGVSLIAEDCYNISIEPAAAISAVLPGQFFMLRRPEKNWPLLPRPFSICRIENGALVFLVKAIGPGTRSLGESKKGDLVICAGPLGTPFPEVKKGEGLVLLAGGIGIAPFPHAVDRALAAGVKPEEIVLVFGARTKSMFYDLPFYRKRGVLVLLAAEDGSEGFRGNAVACLKEEIGAGRIARAKPIFACGPERMLEAAAHLAKAEKLRMFLSLETFMACGVGVCNGCAVPVEPDRFGGWPYAKACREGPIFEACDLRLEED